MNTSKKIAAILAVLILVVVGLLTYNILNNASHDGHDMDGDAMTASSSKHQMGSFAEMSEMASMYCTSPTSTDPMCLEYFQSRKDLSPEMKAQEDNIMVGETTKKQSISPTDFLTTWNFNNLPEEERDKLYKETPQPDGTTLREYWITARDEDIEIAPGVSYPAWTYNGQVPAPTIRATEGDTVKIYFTNAGNKAHTIHSHGFHPASMDGSMPGDFVYPGGTFTYEFKAEPFGLHLYHCHASPLKQHIAKGLYGAYIVDPKVDTRPKADKELVMVMNGFDTDGDGENEVYGVNTEAFYYARNPIQVKQGELVRIFLINVLENDPLNSFHLHGNFFDEYRTGTQLEPDNFTDITSFIQGERAILDVRFKFKGMYMFHAHQSEFTEKGWMGMFEVIE
jgi:manganese oxidase